MEISHQLINAKDEESLGCEKSAWTTKRWNGFLERNRPWREEGRKEGRSGALVMSALRSVLHGELAQVNDFLVGFGAGRFGAKIALNGPLRESESHWALQSSFLFF